MPITHNFSHFAKVKGVQLNAFGSVFRKIGHSGSNKATSFWQNSSKADKAVASIEVVSGVGGVIGLSAGAAVIAAEAAAVVVGSAAFVAAVGGPQIAITAGVLGIGLLVYSSYSNREQLHEDLLPYVWNLIDDTPPSLPVNVMENLDAAAGIAIGLMDDGSSQFKLMGQKLKSKEDQFERFWANDIAPIINYFEKLSATNPSETQIRRFIRIWTSEGPVFKQRNKHIMSAYFRKSAMYFEQMTNHISEAEKQGGEIFEFMRRLMHTGNYIQISNLIYRGSLSKLGAEPNRGTGSDLQDPINALGGDVFNSMPIGKYYRKRLLDMSGAIDKATLDFKHLERLAVAAGLD